VTLPTNSTLPIRLTEEINTKTAKAGDTFHGTTAASVTIPGTPYVAIPTGTAVTGRIATAKPAGRLSGAAELTPEAGRQPHVLPDSGRPLAVTVTNTEG